MKTIVTHNATFHADDVFAVAVYVMANGGKSAWQILRTRDEKEIANADAVVDVGQIYDHAKNRYDHHQFGNAGQRPDGTLYASFGLVWKHFGEQLCGNKEIAENIEKKIVEANDSTDNGVEVSEPIFEGVREFAVSDYVAVMNQTWKESDSAGTEADAIQDFRFDQLVIWATALLERLIERAKHKFEAKSIVSKFYNESEDKKIIIMDKYYPYADVLMEFSEPLIVVYPNIQNNLWSAKVMPKEKDSFENRIKFPEAWAGKTDSQLAEVSGVSDAKFCHTKRFLAVANSKEGAISLAQKAIALA